MLCWICLDNKYHNTMTLFLKLIMILILILILLLILIPIIILILILILILKPSQFQMVTKQECFNIPVADCRVGTANNCKMVPRQVRTWKTHLTFYLTFKKNFLLTNSKFSGNKIHNLPILRLILIHSVIKIKKDYLYYQ